MRKFRSITVRPIFVASFLVVIFLYLQYSTSDSSKKQSIVSSGIKTQKVDDLYISTIILPESKDFEAETVSYIESFKDLNPENLVVVSRSNKPSGIFVSSKAKESARKKLSSIDLRTEDPSDGLYSDLERIFPESDILPLQVGINTEDSILSGFIDELHGTLNERRTLMIVCLDLSSTNTTTAENQRIFTENVLLDFNRNNLLRLGEDTKSFISLGMLWSEKVNSKKFNIAKNGCLETRCFIYGHYNRGNKEISAPTTVFTIGGDMMFDRGINYRFPGDKIFDSLLNINSLFEETDLSLINLEGPISPTPIDSELSYSMVFNFPPKTTEALKRLKINAVSLANNHTNNNGVIGLSNTKKVLGENGIKTIGEEREFNDEGVAEFLGAYTNISVVAINCLEVSTDITEVIRREKLKKNYVIVVPHWGIEYESIHSNSQESLAHRWVESGADLVVGTHPHVIQDAEIYKNKAIFYSIGNLLFDQTWSEPTQKGLIISGTISSEGVKIALLPTKSIGLKPTLMVGLEKEKALEKFNNVLAQNSSDVIILKP